MRARRCDDQLIAGGKARGVGGEAFIYMPVEERKQGGEDDKSFSESREIPAASVPPIEVSCIARA